MNLQILLPFRIFLPRTPVSSVVARTREGSFELLAHRLDCVAALVPGLCAYASAANAQVYVAVDAGILVKCGDEVLICTRRAVGGADLASLHEAVTRDFQSLDTQEREVRAAVGKMQGALLRRFAELRHER